MYNRDKLSQSPLCGQGKQFNITPKIGVYWARMGSRVAWWYSQQTGDYLGQEFKQGRLGKRLM